MTSRGLRRQLTMALVLTALMSLLTVGTINFFAARQLLQEGTRGQLVDVAESRIISIERGVDRILARASTTAADRGVVDALVDFDAGFDDLDDRSLSEEQEAVLEASYRERVVDPLRELEFEVDLDDVLPAPNGRYLQYHYLLPEQTGEVPSEPDTSTYASAIEEHDEFLQAISADVVIDDLLLMSLEGDVVYTAQKYVDLGTSLSDGPLAATALADAALTELPRVRLGEAVVADFEVYLPGGGRPALFVLVGVKADSQVVGALAMRVSIDALNAVTTADQQWERLGLGEGETYVVSSNGVLLSESRTWIEDPDGFLDSVDDEANARLIEAFGSPVGIQPVDSKPVEVALAGDTFVGSTSNYLGDDTFSYARRVSINGLDWIVVAEQPQSELRAPLWSYLWRLATVIAVILPIAALLGYLLSDRLTKSIVPVVRMADSVVAGERNLDPPDLGANEVGDLARQLERMARQLGEQEAALEEEFEERRRLLRSVLPLRLVDDDGEIDGTGQAVDTATVIALVVDLDAVEAADEESNELLGSLADAIERLADELDIERIRTAADRVLLIAGLDRDDDAAQTAVEFVRSVRKAALEDFDENVSLSVSGGLASGMVATGLLDRGNLTFGVWGEPVRRALAIAALSDTAGVLLDESTATSLGNDGVRPADDVLSLDGEPMSLYVLDPAAVTESPDQSTATS